MFALVLTACIVAGYAASLWWLLRAESIKTLLGLAVLCSLSLCVRVVYTTDYPAGLNEDEIKALTYGATALHGGDLFGPGIEGPILLSALFKAQIVPLVGANRWAARVYSLILSVLATAAAFAIGRALGLRTAACMAIGAFIAFLPWSIFYGRISFGGELVFHELLVIAGLTRLLWANGGWPEVAMSSLGLTLLLYGYAAGRSMLAMPLAAAVLVRGWKQRALCATVSLVAVLSLLPYLRTNLHVMAGSTVAKLHPDLAEHPLRALSFKTLGALHALIAPVGRDGWLTISSAGLHPWLILVLAIAGLCLAWRRTPFLLAGFAIGLAPVVLSEGVFASTHRMLMAFPFIAFAAGCALDRIRPRTLRIAATALVVTVVGLQSVRWYFSASFWPPESRRIFDWERTALVEALPVPPHPRLIVDRSVSYYFGLRGVAGTVSEPLTVESWYPPSTIPSLYAFSATAAQLRPFYEDLFTMQRVQAFGRAFLLTLEGGDWSWVAQHGWSYEAHCGEKVWRGQVPALYQLWWTFRDLRCDQAVTHVWRGLWEGPPTAVQLLFSGTAIVDTPAGRLVEKTGQETSADFTLEPHTVVKISVNAGVLPRVGLVAVTPAGTRVPPWEYVTPQPE